MEEGGRVSLPGREDRLWQVEQGGQCSWKGETCPGPIPEGRGSACAWCGGVREGPDMPFMIEHSKIRNISLGAEFLLIILTRQDFLGSM